MASQQDQDFPSEVSSESPSNLPTPDSDVADVHPPSPSKDSTSYSKFILCMAKSLELDIEQPPPPKQDLVFNDINLEKSSLLSLAFILSMLDLIKESWDKPSMSTQIFQHIENYYRTHGSDTPFLVQHPAPNSIIV